MALTQPQQFIETIRRSAHPLVVIPRGAGSDGYASALGLSRVIKKLGAQPDVVAADGPAPATLSFLKDHARVQTRLPELRALVIDIDARKTGIGNIAKEEQDGRVRLRVTPTHGFWGGEDVHVSHSAYRYDLLVCVGAPDLSACAHLYEANQDFFFRTPIVNIDHAPANEHFGHVNVVDVTAAACGEVCYDLISAADPNLMDDEVATAFLTGMIAKTKSFKTPNVSPRTLETASRLMSAGARRDEIVASLYRTRSVATLRLWGRALARLKHDDRTAFVWTLLSQQDFLHAGAEEAELPDVVDELLTSSPSARVVLLLFESRDRNVCAILRAERPYDANRLATSFGAAGTREESRMCFAGKSLVQVEQEIVPKLIERIAQTEMG
jgi:nanoRNase/pAp phosphatase (c-di-AMP/oligoRNAs hydrolase)